MDWEPEVEGREESMISDIYIKESNLQDFSGGRGGGAKYLYTIFVYYDTENTWCIRYRWTEGYITWTKHKLRIAFPSSFWDASLTSNGS